MNKTYVKEQNQSLDSKERVVSTPVMITASKCFIIPKLIINYCMHAGVGLESADEQCNSLYQKKWRIVKNGSGKWSNINQYDCKSLILINMTVNVMRLYLHNHAHNYILVKKATHSKVTVNFAKATDPSWIIQIHLNIRSRMVLSLRRIFFIAYCLPSSLFLHSTTWPKPPWPI